MQKRKQNVGTKKIGAKNNNKRRRERTHKW